MLQTFYRLPESRVHQPATSGQWLHPSRFAPIFRHARLVQLLLIAFISMAAFVMLESMVALFLNSPHTFGTFRDWQVGLCITDISASSSRLFKAGSSAD